MAVRQGRSPAVSRTTGPMRGESGNTSKTPSQGYFTTEERARKGVPIHDHQGRVVGVVRDGVFRKTVDADKHMLRIPPAWSFDVVSLDEAKRAGGKVVELHEERDDVIYRATMRQMDRYGKSLDRGCGKQRFLHVRYWARDGEPVGEQLLMFGEDGHGG